MLNAMRAKDFCLFEQMELPLNKVGLVWVQAFNRDSSAASSNGAGKSTIFKALTWCLYGDCLDRERGDKVIRHGAREARVEVDLEDGWTIVRTRKKGSPSLALLKDGAEYKVGKAEIQDKVAELVGLDFQAFKNTVLYGQNDIERFANPRTKDTERKTMLHKILRTDVLQVAHELAKKKYKEAKAECTRLEHEERLIQGKIDEHDVAGIEDRLARWEGEQEEQRNKLLERAKSHRAKAKKLLASIEEMDANAALSAAEKRYADAAAEAALAKVDWKEAQAALASANEKAAALVAKQVSAEATLEAAEKALARLDKDACPLCTTPLDDGVAAKHVESLREARAVAKKNDKEATKAHDVQRQVARDARSTQENKRAKMDAADDALAKAREARSEAKELKARQSADAAEAERLINEARAAKAEADALSSKENPWSDFLSRTLETQSNHRKALEVVERERERVAANAAHLQFWVRGYSGRGMPSFVIDSVMPYLTERTNHYLMTLADGDITVEFSTQRELKSTKGEMRDEIDITWIIEGKPDYPPSGGQQRKIEIASDLALMDLCETRESTSMGLFMADEVLEGLDAEGVERVLDLLKELRTRRGSIFVISHTASMSEIFERSLTITKEDGVSTLERSW